MARTKDFPASNLIRFLSAYGPSEQNTNLYDEHVLNSANKYQLKPIELKADFVEPITERLREKAPSVIFVTGVAGDGKSYHLRKVWNALGGDIDDWNTTLDPTLIYTLADGQTVRPIHFVKDLTATKEDAFEALWERMKNAISANESFIVACNHGQILSRLNTLDDSKAHECAENLQKRFFCATKSDTFFEHFHLFDLSHVDASAKFLEIVQHVVEHEGWKACEGWEACSNDCCPHLANCPIRKNLQKLWCDGKAGVAADRMAKLVQLSVQEGFHYSIRELLMLAINAILGASHVPGKPLGSCHVVNAILSADAEPQKEQSPKIDLYENLLGANLPQGLLESKSVFRRLGHFQIGTRDDPAFDSFALTGHKGSEAKVKIWNELFGDLEENVAVTEAEEDSKSPKLADELARRATFLAAARRRMFFALDSRHSEVLPEETDIWRLTNCRHYKQYKELTSTEDKTRRSIRKFYSYLCTGLNRIFTGIFPRDNQEKIYITTQGAQSNTPVGELVVAKLSTEKNASNVSIHRETPNVAPILVIRSGKEIEFTLTPQRFEYICGVAEGTLPTSFSSQCRSEFNALKSKIIRLEESINNNCDSEDNNNETNTIEVISFDLTDSKSIDVDLLRFND